MKRKTIIVGLSWRVKESCRKFRVWNCLYYYILSFFDFLLPTPILKKSKLLSKNQSYCLFEFLSTISLLYHPIYCEMMEIYIKQSKRNKKYILINSYIQVITHNSFDLSLMCIIYNSKVIPHIYIGP